MSDGRRHRGPHPSDPDLFGNTEVTRLRDSVFELSWLLSHGYVNPSALKLVGDRHHLTQRQRTAVMRSSCSEDSLHQRATRKVLDEQLTNASVVIDGFNLLTSIEAALSGGVILRCQDGVFRDMASMHGTYRTVYETEPALRLIGKTLQSFQVTHVHWWLDRPVSNSGRLASLIREIALTCQWSWTAELDINPDQRLVETTDAIVVSADSMVIENCSQWWPLANRVICREIADAWVLQLSSDA